MSKKNLYIFSAPSGCGKTSLAQALIQSRDDVAMATSHTTRAIRKGERNGKDYFFVSTDAFKSMIEKDQFLEFANVFDNFYGTSTQAAKSLMAQGKHVILDIDWQGARQVRDHYPEVISVFIVPPSIDALEQRLRARGQDDDTTIARRMEGAKNELSHQNEYDFQIVNDDFEQALNEIERLFETSA